MNKKKEQIIITLYPEQDNEELFGMFKLICDNIGTNGVSCEKSKTKLFSEEELNNKLNDLLFRVNANNEDLELHEFNDYIIDFKAVLGLGE